MFHRYSPKPPASYLGEWIHSSEACYLQSAAHWNIAWLSWNWENGPPRDRQERASLVEQTMRWHIGSGYVCLSALPDQQTVTWLMHDRTPADFVSALMCQAGFGRYPLQKLYAGKWGQVLQQRLPWCVLNATAQQQLETLDLPLTGGVRNAQNALQKIFNR